MLKKTFLKIELMYGGKSQGSYLEPTNKPTEIELENDTYYRISLVKMTQKKFESLPEFEGF